MDRPSVIITPFVSDSGYNYVKVEVWADALNRYIDFDFQVCGPNRTAESVAFDWLTKNDNANLRYWQNANQGTLDSGRKMVEDIMRDAAIYGHCD